MSTDALLETLSRAVDEVADAIDKQPDWARPGIRPGQYAIDRSADEAALGVLLGAGLDVLSEESGFSGQGGRLLAVVDPVDGSTNASRHIPWYATSICILDGTGPLCALVGNLALGTRYETVRGEGARRDGEPIAVSRIESLNEAVVATSGMGERPLEWRQFRSFGAAALDLCAVADGSLDAFCDFSSALGPWDYLGGMLVCQEAGGVVADAAGRELVTRQHADRRSPAAAATTCLLDELLAARAGRGR